MGRPKLTMPWRDSTVIEQVLNAWKASRVSHVIVVVRPDDQDLVDVCRQSGIEPVIPGESPSEMKVSIAIALDYVERTYAPTDSDVWLLAPADFPNLQALVIDQLLDNWDSSSKTIVAPTVCGQRGHPVLFPWMLATKVTNLKANEGVNALLDLNPVREIEIADRSILEDLDTQEDYQRLHGK